MRLLHGALGPYRHCLYRGAAEDHRRPAEANDVVQAKDVRAGHAHRPDERVILALQILDRRGLTIDDDAGSASGKNVKWSRSLANVITTLVFVSSPAACWSASRPCGLTIPELTQSLGTIRNGFRPLIL